MYPFDNLFQNVLTTNAMAPTGRKRKASVSLQDAVAETLECPVCLQTIKDPPVFLCANGHELCQKCREPLKAEGKPCPVCQGELIDVRCRAVEMLEKLPRTECKYEGCTFARSDTQLVKSHEEKECRMKPVKCEVCNQQVALSEIYDHFGTNHNKVPCTIAGLGVESTYHGRWPGATQVPLVKVNSDLKFLINRRQYDENITMFWISLCGTQVEAEEYEYTIKIRHPTEQREDRKYLFTGSRDCVSCDVSHEDMKVKGEGLLLNNALLEKAAVENDGNFLKFKWC